MTRFEITGDHRRQLRDQGWVLLPGALPRALLRRWRSLATRIERDVGRAHARGEAPAGAAVVEDEVGPRLTRFNDLHGAEPDALLELLACPGMMAVARELCRRGTVPLQADLLYKQPHPHPVTLWHQDAPHPRGHPYLNLGVYLDDAAPGDGCLRYLPGSQHQLQDIASLARRHGWDLPGVVEQPACAGDILVHDMMVLHGSPPKRTPGCRRTLYIELRPCAGILEGGSQSRSWMETRQRWMGLVVRRAGPEHWPAPWRADLPGDLGTDEAEMGRVMACREAPTPAHYAREDVETEDYPIPRDLRGVAASA